jgi:hypothetical protein
MQVPRRVFQHKRKEYTIYVIHKSILREFKSFRELVRGRELKRESSRDERDVREM